ncbi:hypothetical protein ACOME3_006955 [Neoechinorhynchus agilis]
MASSTPQKSGFHTVPLRITVSSATMDKDAPKGYNDLQLALMSVHFDDDGGTSVYETESTSSVIMDLKPFHNKEVGGQNSSNLSINYTVNISSSRQYDDYSSRSPIHFLLIVSADSNLSRIQKMEILRRYARNYYGSLRFLNEYRKVKNFDYDRQMTEIDALMCSLAILENIDRQGCGGS